MSFLFLFFCACSFLIGNQAKAKELSVTITKDINQDAVVSVEWKKGTPTSLQLVSPTGDIYDEKKTPDNIRVSGHIATFCLEKMKKGKWKVILNGIPEGQQVIVETGQLLTDFEVSSFSVKEEGKIIKGSYELSNLPGETVLKVFATQNENNFTGKCLCIKKVKKKKGSFSFAIKNLPSGEYHFYLQAEYQGAIVRKYADETLSHSRQGDLPALTGVCGGKYNDGYYIQWNSKPKVCYQIKVWDEDSNLISEEQITGVGFFYHDFPEKQKKIFVAVVKANTNMQYQKIEIMKKAKVEATVEFEAEGKYSTENDVAYQIEFGEDCIWNEYVDDICTLRQQKKDGNFSTYLKDGEHDIGIQIKDADGNMKEYDKTIIVDTVPPSLSMDDDVNHQTTSKDFIWLSGYSDASAELTVNGAAVTRNGSYFNHKVSLEYGENTIRVIARDAAGNTTVYDASVTSKKKQQTIWWIVITAVVMAGIILSYLITIILHYTKRK